MRKVVEPESSCVLLSWCQTPPHLPFFPLSKRDILQMDLSHWSSTYFFIVFPFISHFWAYFSSFIKIKGRIKAEYPVSRSVQRVSRYPEPCQLENEMLWGNSAWAWPLFQYSWADDVINSAGGFQGGRPGKEGGDTQIRPFDNEWREMSLLSILLSLKNSNVFIVHYSVVWHQLWHEVAA